MKVNSFDKFFPSLTQFRAVTIMRGFFGNCAMRVAGDLGKIVHQNPQNLTNMRRYAGLGGVNKLSIQETNSTQSTITIQKHRLFNCFRIKGPPVSRQDLVVLGKGTFNT